MQHQAKAGMDPSAILAGLNSLNPKNAGEADKLATIADQNSTDAGGEPDPMKAYRNMLRDGMGHAEIVRSLADFVVQTLDRQESEQGIRSAGQSRMK